MTKKGGCDSCSKGGKLKLTDIKLLIKKIPKTLKLSLVGSAGRGKQEPEDIDFITKDVPLTKVRDYFKKTYDKYKKVSEGEKYLSFKINLNGKPQSFNIWFATKKEYPLFYFWLAYPGVFNQRVRGVFKKCGYTLSQHSLTDNKGKEIKINNYKDIFKQLQKLGYDYKYRTPKQEEKKGGILGLPSLSEIKTRVVDFIKGPREGAPPQIRKLLEKEGNNKITNLTVCRVPIYKAINTFFNIITLGQFDKAKKQLNYDDLYHLFIFIKLDNGKSFRMEKNEVVRVDETHKTEGTCLVVPVMKDITLLQLFDNGIKQQPKNFWLYDPKNNNCQVFITSLLNGSGLNSPHISKFVLQDAVTLFNKVPGYTHKIAKAITDFASRFDILRHGKGLDDIKGGKTLTKEVLALKLLSNFMPV